MKVNEFHRHGLTQIVTRMNTDRSTPVQSHEKVFNLYKILLKRRKKSNYGWLQEAKFVKKRKTVLAIDEAGRGALAGPLSVGGLFLDQTALRLLQQHRIEFFDSKQLDSKSREVIAEIIKKIKVPHKVVLISHKIIDKKGINQAFLRAVEKLLDYFEPNCLVLDGRRIKVSFSPKCYFFVKGDQRLNSIGGASIAAKVKRDDYMCKLSQKFPQYKFETHKGYGTKLHKKLIRKHGLSRVHRKSFCRFV